MISVVAISAGVAYAMTVAIAGAPSSGNGSTTIAAEQAAAQALMVAGPAESATAPAVIDLRGEACDTTGGRMLYVGLNSWIPAESGAGPCPGGIP